MRLLVDLGVRRDRARRPGEPHAAVARAVDDHGAAIAVGAASSGRPTSVTAGSGLAGPYGRNVSHRAPASATTEPSSSARSRPSSSVRAAHSSGCHRPPSHATVTHPSRHSRIARPRIVDRRMGQLASPQGPTAARAPGGRTPAAARGVHHGRQRALGGAPRPAAHRRPHRGRGEPGPRRAGRRQARHRVAHRVRLLHRELGASATRGAPHPRPAQAACSAGSPSSTS